MEGTGLLHAIWEWPEKVNCDMIEAVSDLGDLDMTVDKDTKQTTAARRALQVALEILRAY